MFLLVLASVSPLEWVTYADYPQSAMSEHHEGSVKAEYGFDTSGHPYQCKIMVSSRWPELDEATCRGIMKRARIEPFVDSAGQPLAVIGNFKFGWYLTNDMRPYNPLMTDAEIDLAAIPKGVKRSFANVACIVTAEAKTESCFVWKDGGTGLAALDEVARNALAKATFPVANDPSGKPMRYVRLTTVVFRVPGKASLTH